MVEVVLRENKGIYATFHNRIIVELTKFNLIYLYLSATDASDTSTKKLMLDTTVSYWNTGRILMMYMLIWRRIERFGYYYVSFTVLEDLMLSSFECIKKSGFLLQLHCHLIWVSWNLLYGPFVKHVCSKKLSMAQCIYLVNVQDRQWIKERKYCFPNFCIWEGLAESTKYSG